MYWDFLWNKSPASCCHQNNIIFVSLSLTIYDILFFSIYFLATNELTSFDFNTIGFITPVGGVFLMVGWVLLGFGCLRHLN